MIQFDGLGMRLRLARRRVTELLIFTREHIVSPAHKYRNVWNEYVFNSRRVVGIIFPLRVKTKKERFRI